MSYDPATYIDGVPVKISEKYRPPRKVAPSPLGNYQVNTEILTAEYSLTVENETLKWLQNIKNYKDNKKKIQEEKIKQYLDEKARLKEEEEKKLKEEEEKKQKELEEAELKKSEEKDTKDQEEEDGNEELTENLAQRNETLNTSESDESNKGKISELSEANTQSTEEKEKTEENDESVSEDNFNNSNTTGAHCAPSENINIPSTSSQQYLTQASQSPMLVPVQCSPQVSNHKSPTKINSKINFAEFEGDASDPFDSVALKSINDMEELAKILQESSIKQQKSSHINSNLNYGQQGGYLNGGYLYNPYPYGNYHQQLNMSVNNRPQYNQSASYQPKMSTVPFAGKPNPVFQKEDFSQWSHMGHSNASGPTEIPQFSTYNYSLPQGVITSSNSNVKTSLDHSYANRDSSTFHYRLTPTPVVGTSLPVSNSLHAQNTALESVEKRQDLEDFYTRYYSNKKSFSGVRSGDSTPTTQQQNNKNLPSSNSVPDLTVIEDNEVSNIVSNNHFDKTTQKYSNCLTPPRPSSTVSYEVLNKSNVQGTNKSGPSSGVKSRLSDPFSELNEEAQSLVQSIAEMGFPRPRVARAVQKLGTDHKKLLEVLLTLQSYQENGDDEYLSERAFYFFMGQVDKVNEFLSASKTLLNLGFEEEKVIDCLFKYENDREKCLEELIA